MPLTLDHIMTDTCSGLVKAFGSFSVAVLLHCRHILKSDEVVKSERRMPNCQNHCPLPRRVALGCHISQSI